MNQKKLRAKWRHKRAGYRPSAPISNLLSARHLSVLAMASGPRFAVNTDADINQVLKEAVPPYTRKSTDMCVSVFNKFCSEQDINLDLAICSANELNDAN